MSDGEKLIWKTALLLWVALLFCAWLQYIGFLE